MPGVAQNDEAYPQMLTISQEHIFLHWSQASKISDLAPDGSVTVVASVEEAAELWASNGRKGDSYHTTYQVSP